MYSQTNLYLHTTLQLCSNSEQPAAFVCASAFETGSFSIAERTAAIRVSGVTSFTRSHERKSRGFVWVRPNHAGIIANLSKPLWASDLLSVGIHYFAGVVDDAEEVL